MPSSSTNYSYDIPTVGSDSTTYGTIINQFVESLSAKLKTVSDKINTAGVGASSTLAQVNRNIAQVDAINSRIPVGVADLLPDPYSGATTPVSTWPYLNTELQAEGFSPPTTAQEVLDFDYSGFATYLNTRFDSLSARILGLDAPITISDSSTLICETNKILAALGTTKTVTSTVSTTSSVETEFYTLLGGYYNSPFPGAIYHVNSVSLATLLEAEGIGSFDDRIDQNGNPYTIYTAGITISDVTGRLDSGEAVPTGIYLQGSTEALVTMTIRLGRSNYAISGIYFPETGRITDTSPDTIQITGADYSVLSPYTTETGGQKLNLYFKRVVTGTVTTEVSSQVPVTLADIDLSDC